MRKNMNRYCSIAGLFMLASVFVFSRPVPAESGHNVFREYSSFEACYESAKQGDAKAYEGMGDFMLHQGIFNPDKKAAAAWYTKAARYGRGSAAEKLRALGVSAPAVGGDRAPVCPDREDGDASVSGVVVDPQTDHTDAHGILIRDDSGRTIDILTGNGDVPEFEGLRRGGSRFAQVQYLHQSRYLHGRMRSDVFLYGELGPYQTLREPVGRFGSQRMVPY